MTRNYSQSHLELDIAKSSTTIIAASSSGPDFMVSRYAFLIPVMLCPVYKKHFEHPMKRH